MYVYLRAALRGTRQHGGWKGGNSPLPATLTGGGLVLPVTCSSLILFSLTVPVVSLSFSLYLSLSLSRLSYSSTTRFIFPPSSLRLLLCLCAFSHVVSSLPSRFISSCLLSLSIFLSTCFIRDYASCIACRSGADILLLVRCNCWWNLKVHTYLHVKEKDAGRIEHEGEYLS